MNRRTFEKEFDAKIPQHYRHNGDNELEWEQAIVNSLHLMSTDALEHMIYGTGWNWTPPVINMAKRVLANRVLIGDS